MDNKKKKTICVVVLLGMLVLSYFLAKSFGHIENSDTLVPTGNVDIFEISCERCCKSGDDSSDETAVPNTASKEKRFVEGRGYEDKQAEGEQSGDEQTPEEDRQHGEVIVYDDYKIWDNKDLRIFANPAYEYRHVIAPGSFNSYAFVIRNNNDFDVDVDVLFNEVNEKNINMQYKLKNDGKYLLGSVDNYETIAGKVIGNITIPANGYESYVLDWKWVDSSNDAEVGFDVNSFYKLSIKVATK